MEVTYITVPEDEDASTLQALQALVQLYAAVKLSTLVLAGGGYSSFREGPSTERRKYGRLAWNVKCRLVPSGTWVR